MIRYVKPYHDEVIAFHNDRVNVYDDIVDKSEFRPDTETIRGLKLSAGSKLTDCGLYDYKDGKIPEVDTVTPELLALREGKLDRADVQKLAAEADAALKDSVSIAEKEKLLAEKEAVLNARQSYIDSEIGFDPSLVGANKE